MQNPEVRREEEGEEEEEESLESLKQRANEDYILFLQTVLLPREEDDPTYIRSFALEETEAIQQFYQRYGLVVIRDVFSSQECQDTVEDIFSLLEQGSKQRWQRSDPSTWGNWPSSGIEKYGMPSKAPVTTRVAFRNRQNAKLLQACSTLFTKDTELMISIDRYGLCRPTVGVPFGSSLKDMPQWKTAPSLHLDVNPWAFLSETNHALPKLSALEYGRHRLNDFIFENNQVHHSTSANGVHIQGVINLLDNREEDGGFHCVPGFLHCFDAWAKENEHSQTEQKAWDQNSVLFPESHPFQRFAKRVPMRAGSVVLWDIRMPHGSRSNNSGNMRAAQFFKMFPKQPALVDALCTKARRETIAMLLQACGFQNELSEVGKVVFGLAKSGSKPNKKKSSAKG